MPKEITHWTLAEKAALRVKEPFIRKVIANNRYLYFLGAVSPDTPYYQVSPVTTDLYEEVGRQIHGVNVKNSFEVLARVTRRFEEIPPPVLAFLLGLISHLIVDAEYHPLIYHFTGNYYSKNNSEKLRAMCRHRLLETYLDLHYYGNEKPANGYSVYTAYTKKEMTNDDYLDLLGDLYFNNRNSHRQNTKIAVWGHCIWYSCFKRRWLKYPVGIASRLSPFDLRHYAVLFYPHMQAIDSTFFNGRISYRNHATDGQTAETIRDIEERAVATIIRHFDMTAGMDGKALSDLFSSPAHPAFESVMASMHSSENAAFENGRDIKELVFG